jgi:hypothetical protein
MKFEDTYTPAAPFPVAPRHPMSSQDRGVIAMRKPTIELPVTS